MLFPDTVFSVDLKTRRETSGSSVPAAITTFRHVRLRPSSLNNSQHPETWRQLLNTFLAHLPDAAHVCREHGAALEVVDGEERGRDEEGGGGELLPVALDQASHGSLDCLGCLRPTPPPMNSEEGVPIISDNLVYLAVYVEAVGVNGPEHDGEEELQDADLLVYREGVRQREILLLRRHGIEGLDILWNLKLGTPALVFRAKSP